jgi:DNA mismatch endonuclease (patch repair protein)
VTDIVSKEQRSRIMAAIGPVGSAPELVLRKFLHQRGFRFRLHVRDLAGRPDIVMRRYRVVLFVHGCFWHQHPNCALAAVPASNTDFWKKKLDANRKRDADQITKLRSDGWRVGVFWECAARKGIPDTKSLRALEQWLKQTSDYREFPASPLREKLSGYSRAKIL